jgi:membrane protein insertase Oxa1/YidC/SpoIIIJ
MMIMNVVMVVLFYGLPSGLVLYWTVMNLLTALQQWLVLRGDGHEPAPAAGGTPVARKATAK